MGRGANCMTLAQQQTSQFSKPTITKTTGLNMSKIRPKMKTGTVRTNKVGSDCTFEICELDEWNQMNESMQEKALEEAMWSSGILNVFPNDEP